MFNSRRPTHALEHPFITVSASQQARVNHVRSHSFLFSFTCTPHECVQHRKQWHGVSYWRILFICQVQRPIVSFLRIYATVPVSYHQKSWISVIIQVGIGELIMSESLLILAMQKALLSRHCLVADKVTKGGALVNYGMLSPAAQTTSPRRVAQSSSLKIVSSWDQRAWSRKSGHLNVLLPGRWGSLHLWVSCQALSSLQCGQNSLARVVTTARPFAHATLWLQSLHWLPIKFRTNHNTLLTFKTQGTELCTLLSRTTHSHTLI